MNTAALTAALRGDMANAIIASTPGGIERQEAQGQCDLVSAANKLPADMRPDDRAALESLGFVFGAPVDEIFIAVQMPAGWAIRPTEHSMHSDLVDPQGRRRGGIFYKAAFYDRKADFNLTCRYSARCDYEKPTSTHFIEDSADGSRKHVVGTTAYAADYQAIREIDKEASAWLEANLPDYRNPLAYWDAS